MEGESETDVQAQEAPAEGEQQEKEVEPKPVEAEGETEGDKPEAKDKPKAKEPASDDDESDDDGEPKRRSGSQRLRRKLAMEIAEKAALRAEVEALKKGPAKDARPGIEREPQEADFPNDYFAFERARTAWDVRQAIRAEQQERETVQRTARQTEEQIELHEDYAENAEAVRERIPDFDRVIAGAGAGSPELMTGILQAGKKAPLLAYHLAKNPAELARLNTMTGTELARELGRLESRVHLPQPNKTTKADAPLSSVKGGAAPTFDPFKTDDMDAYVAWRKKGGGR